MKKPRYTAAYRLEHPLDGTGPYRSGHTDDELLSGMMRDHSAYTSNKHPTPRQDGIEGNVMYTPNDPVCGARNIKQLKSWFGRYLTPLRKAGFALVKYYVPIDRVYAGKRQVVFDRKFAPISKTIHQPVK